MSDRLADLPIPIVISIEVSLATVSGTVKTKLPLPGEGMLYGDEQFGTCNLRSDLGGLTVLTMKGGCGPTVPSIEGKYVLRLRDGSRRTGTFKLTRVRADKATEGTNPRAVERQPSDFSGLTPAQCIKTNSACLLACPRGDYNVELLCANQCKRNYNSCKGRRSSPAGISEMPGGR